MNKLSIFFSLFVSVSVINAITPVIPAKKDTKLIKAVKFGTRKEVKRILKKESVPVNALGIDQKTAMDIAVESGDTKTSILISKYGGKVTRRDNVLEFKSMLEYRSKRLLKTFGIMFLFAMITVYPIFWLCVDLVEISSAYLALAIPAGTGLVLYAGYMWSRLFEGLSLRSKVEQNWMLYIPEVA